MSRLAGRTLAICLLGVALLACSSGPRAVTIDTGSESRPEPIPRVALVIGEEHYTYDPPFYNVTNAQADADAIAAALSQLHFDPIWQLPDPSDAAIRDYITALAQYTTRPGQPAFAVVFFAGHGFNRNGYDYVIPTNSTATDDSDIPLTEFINKLVPDNAKGGVMLFLVDACRTAALGEVAVVPNEGHASPKPAILSLATRMNWTAASGTRAQKHSPYTTGLLKYLSARGASVAEMLDKVGVEMGPRQQSEKLGLAGASPTMVYLTRTDAQNKSEAHAWTTALNSGSGVCIQRFIDSHPDSAYLGRALRWQSEHLPPESQEGTSCPDP